MAFLNSNLGRIADLSDLDDANIFKVVELQALGYQEVLVRTRGFWHIMFMTIAILCVPYGLTAPLATALIGGGPATMIWGWVLVSCFTFNVALSLGEIVSKYPTAGGAYYWCYRLTSPQNRVLASWINGWLTMVAVWTISLSVTVGVAQLAISGASIIRPEWTASPWETYLIFIAVITVVSAIGIFFNGTLPKLEILSVYWTIIGLLMTVIGLSATAAAGRRSVSFALFHFDPSASGWSPGWTFFIGLLPLFKVYTYAGIGMVASMAEEVRDPSITVPKAIIWSIPFGLICGLCFYLPIVFTLPDMQLLLAEPSGQPIGLLYRLVLGSTAGAFVMWFYIFGLGIFCATSICCVASRATWSFARDRGIPGHRIFSHVNPRLGVPLNAYMLSTAIQVLLGLLLLGSTAAFNAFVGVGSMCLGASYAMPVAISLMNGRKDVADSLYNLGRWGFLVNTITVVWLMFEMVLFSMPAKLPVTKSSMNYASVVFVGFAAMSAICMVVGSEDGRYHYTGPHLPDPVSHIAPIKNSNDELINLPLELKDA